MLADVFRETWALQAWTLHAGAVWQPLTYAFVHGGWAHLLANLFGLALTGAALEAVLGARRLVWLFALGAAAGACGFLLTVLLMMLPMAISRKRLLLPMVITRLLSICKRACTRVL